MVQANGLAETFHEVTYKPPPALSVHIPGCPEEVDRTFAEALAKDRAVSIKELRYQLTFFIPPKRTEPIRANEVIRFNLERPREIVLDRLTTER